MNDKDLAWLKKRLLKFDLIIHAPFIGLSLISCHEEICDASLKSIKKTIDYAEKLEAKVVTVHAGKYPFFMTKGEILNNIAKNFGELVSYADGKTGWRSGGLFARAFEAHP